MISKLNEEAHTLQFILRSSSFKERQVTDYILQMDYFWGTRVSWRSTRRGDGTFVHFQTWKKKNICLYILKEIHSALKQTNKKGKWRDNDCIDHIKNCMFLRHQTTQTSGTSITETDIP